MKKKFRNLKYDLPASLVVFLVALPLCLGIALASGAPLFSGIISGIVGGIVVGSLSNSPLGVSGPAAGLSVIVLGYISLLGSWQALLLATVIMGIIQIICGYLRFGTIAYYFPSSVVKGMLAGIGLLIILKQIPHGLGYDADFETSLYFGNYDLQTILTEMNNIVSHLTAGSVLVTIVSMSVLILWEAKFIKRNKILKIFPAPLLAVITGIILYNLFQNSILPFTLSPDQVVKIPVSTSLGEFMGQFTFPDFSHLLNPNIYAIAFVMAIVASLETLLCVEATDKLDPLKRLTSTNRELKAQGFGNIVSGLIGGLPITQVIVRSSANISFGAKTKISTISHGILLLICAISIPNLLNMIPMATLACILFVVGYKLAPLPLFKKMYKLGWEQFAPFIATVAGMLFFDLLKGVGIGMVIGIFYILRNNFRNSHQHITNSEEKDTHIIELAQEVSFLNKGSIIQILKNIPNNSKVTIDGSKSTSIDFDIIEIIKDFKISSRSKNISLTTKGINLK
jgi:MFS superfamily sulfate permease-like transporter